MVIKISDKVKEFLRGFIVVLTISAFTFLVVKIYTEKNTEGTLCSIQGAAIITLLNYASNADAIADGRIKKHVI